MDLIMRRRIRNRIRKGVTIDKVLASLKEGGERHKVFDLECQEIKQMQKETAMQMKETDRIVKETSISMKETDRKMQETAMQMKETDRKIAILNEQMGGLHRSFGEMAEHLVAPGIVERFNEMGFHIREAATHGFKIFDEKRKVRTEIDLLMGNGEYIIAVEVKAKLGEKDIEKHQKRLEILREDKNMTGDRRKILGGMAVAILGAGDKETILNAGFYVLVQAGDTMKLDMPENFKPREW
jgi:hypothetical protein